MSNVYCNSKPLYSYGPCLACLDEYAGVGLGFDLVLKVLKYTKEYGSEGFKCEINPQNKHILKFYTKLGFTIEEERVYKNTGRPKILMVKQFK
jgi:ribosomal protein S18 acetylase RimI-like enzyme